MMLSWRRRWWRDRVPEGSAARDFLQPPLPARGAALADVAMLVLDFETTGLEPAVDRIVSAGWLRLESGRLRMAGADAMRLRGDRSVGDSAVVHGLRDMDLEDAPGEDALLETLLRALAGRTLLAHGARIERGFLDAAHRRRYRAPWLGASICTLTLEARLREHAGEAVVQGGLSLPACRARHGLPAYREHDALADALACAELFMAQVEEMGGFERVRLGAVLG